MHIPLLFFSYVIDKEIPKQYAVTKIQIFLVRKSWAVINVFWSNPFDSKPAVMLEREREKGKR